jgi:hypothetical protein
MINLTKLLTMLFNPCFLAISILVFFQIPLRSQDFEVAPVLIAFDANPGEIQTKILTIRNHSNERQKFVMNLNDYILNEKGAKQGVEAGSTSRSMAEWLTINPAFIELNPNESAEIQLNLSVPRNGFSTRWGMIPVELAREQSASGVDKQLTTGVLLVPRIIVLLTQSPRSNQDYRGTVSGVTEVTKPGDLYRSFEATLINQGDKILDAKIFLAVANIETLEEEQMKPTSVTVYPDQSRKVTLTLNKQLQPGKYAVAFLMDYGHRTSIEGSQILLEIE